MVLPIEMGFRNCHEELYQEASAVFDGLFINKKIPVRIINSDKIGIRVWMESLLKW